MKRKYKYSNEDVDAILIPLNFQRLEDYKGTDAKINFKCLICSHIWKGTPYNILNKVSGCPFCAGNSKINNLILDQKLIGTNIQRIDNYIGSSKSITFKCLVCDYIFTTAPSNIINHKTKCAKCYGNAKLNNQLIDNNLLNIKRIDNYISYHEKIHFQCLKCFYLWKTSPASILSLKSGCPKCNIHANEKIIYDLFIINNLNFKYQYPLKNIDKNYTNNHIVDFIIDNNIIIEYNGRQHYEPVQFGNISNEIALSNLISQMKRDNQVSDFCKLKNLQLITIDGRIYKKEKLKLYINNLIEIFRK